MVADALAKSSSGLLEVSIIDDCRLVIIENLILINLCLYRKGNPKSYFMVKKSFRRLTKTRAKSDAIQKERFPSWTAIGRTKFRAGNIGLQIGGAMVTLSTTRHWRTISSYFKLPFIILQILLLLSPRTLYMKGFPVTASLDDIIPFVDKVCMSENVFMRRIKEKSQFKVNAIDTTSTELRQEGDFSISTY